jgi:hypothetical protein
MWSPPLGFDLEVVTGAPSKGSTHSDVLLSALHQGPRLISDRLLESRSSAACDLASGTRHIISALVNGAAHAQNAPSGRNTKHNGG